MIPTAQAQKKKLRVRVPTSPVEASVDAMRLRQILGNLLSNALKFTPEGGEITVTLTQTGAQAILRVQDTGRGINAEGLQHIFEPFYQVTSGKPRTGIGIGLSIVKALVELHHGTIRVESPGEDQGSTFIVTLPCTAGAKK
jgi:signal transduction histidine kinase